MKDIGLSFYKDNRSFLNRKQSGLLDLLAGRGRKLWQGRLQFWGAVTIVVILLLPLAMRYFYLNQKTSDYEVTMGTSFPVKVAGV